MTLDELTAYLHAQIPVTAALGTRVEHYDGASVRISAPLARNVNHLGTAFGGSLAAVAILAGWSLVELQLRDRGVRAHVVIQRGTLEFEAPVDGDFAATATLPDPAAWDRFLAILARHRAARVTVTTTLTGASGVVGGVHEGTFVATRA